MHTELFTGVAREHPVSTEKCAEMYRDLCRRDEGQTIRPGSILNLIQLVMKMATSDGGVNGVGRRREKGSLGPQNKRDFIKRGLFFAAKAIPQVLLRECRYRRRKILSTQSTAGDSHCTV